MDDFLHVTIDTTFEDIVKWDEQSKRVDFAHEPGKFKELSEKQLEQLSVWAKRQYFLSKNMNKQAKAEEESPIKGLKVSPRLVSPGNKLAVEYKEGFRDKWHPAWLRADGHYKHLRDGYQPITHEEIEHHFAPGLGAGSTVQIGTERETELILYKLPLEEHERRLAAAGRVSSDRVATNQENTMEAIRQGGGQASKPPEGNDGRNWSSLPEYER